MAATAVFPTPPVFKYLNLKPIGPLGGRGGALRYAMSAPLDRVVLVMNARALAEHVYTIHVYIIQPAYRPEYYNSSFRCWRS